MGTPQQYVILITWLCSFIELDLFDNNVPFNNITWTSNNTGIPRICNFILLLIICVRSFSNMLHSVKFTEDKVLVFIILHENAKIVQF